MDEEVEAAERFAPARAVGVGNEEIGAEADEATYRIGPSLENGVVEIASGDPAAARRADRPLLHADRLGALGGRHELSTAHVVHGHAREDHVAARRIEAAGERAHQRDRAVGLRRVGVLADAGPAVVGDRPALKKHARHGADLRGLDPADLGGALGRSAAAERAVELEGGGNDARACVGLDRVVAEKGRVPTLILIGAARGIVKEGACRGFVPGNELMAVAAGC